MQGGQSIDGSHVRVPCDLCCVQESALARPACKWASGVCMSCAWFCRHACSPLQANLSSVRSDWMVPTNQSEVGTVHVGACDEFGNFPNDSFPENGRPTSGRRPEPIAALSGKLSSWVPHFHTPPTVHTPNTPYTLRTKSPCTLSEPDPGRALILRS